MDSRTIVNVSEIKEFIENYNGNRKGLTVNSKDLDALMKAIPNIKDLVELNTFDCIREGVGRLLDIGNLKTPVGIIFFVYEDEDEDDLAYKWSRVAYHGWNNSLEVAER